MIIWHLGKYLSFYRYFYNKCPSLFKIRIGTRRVKAKAIGKKEILDLQIEQQLQESHRRWYKDTDVISRIVQLGKELGHQPTTLDLLCRFERAEIASVSDLLPWLLMTNDEEQQNVTTASASDPTIDDDIDLAAGQQENPVKIMAPSEKEQLDDASQPSESGSDPNAR